MKMIKEANKQIQAILRSHKGGYITESEAILEVADVRMTLEYYASKGQEKHVRRFATATFKAVQQIKALPKSDACPDCGWGKSRMNAVCMPCYMSLVESLEN